MGRVAAFVSPGKSLKSAVEHVRLAESLGYETVFASQTTGRDGLMTLAAYVNATSTIKLGTGVLPVFPRHPVALAIEAATFDELAGGRLILGVGPSHQITMEGWYGISMAKPLSQMREYVTILRSIFTTDGVQFDGDFYHAHFGFLGYGARKDLPIYIAALAPNMLRFCAQTCDGTILWGCLPRYIRETVTPTLTAAAADAGRPTPDIVAAIPACVTTDREAAFDALRGDFFIYMTLPFYRRCIEGAGYGAEIEAFDKARAAGDMAGALAAMSERMLDDFAAVGDAGRVRDKIAEYRDTGVTLPGIGVFDSKSGFAGWEETMKAAAG